ncbi:L,D-transpeptidase family protein [Clostridium sp. 'White wine YQ']|uniref:L,D-transpeptidase family protein n=1 Tax=Clostridium sp. 'White wine YQ' TaxID=3027474 RepID=UPI002365D6CE|nr:L,D-transpeptidase family protein [Clostridium sp. 'White wine YQ']MDD7795352.1 peptidoglycan binding domain-containing protein [Clostridium sp. 'White wine YQ']
MRNIKIKEYLKSKTTGNIIIALALIVLIYLSVSLYFGKHFFFNTVINGVDVSLKSHEDVGGIFKSHVEGYKLQLNERNGVTEEIIGQDIDMKYNEQNNISEVYEKQKSIKWITAILKKQKYYVDDLYSYNKTNLGKKINELSCLKKDIIEPKNVSFKYSNGSYEVIEEVYGNKVLKENLNKAIENSILQGDAELDLSTSKCYENPKYTLKSDKTTETKNLLDKYVTTKITYKFGSKDEVLDGDTISKWLNVDEDLEVVISEKAVKEYLQELSSKYDTVGITRKFKSSIGKIVEVKGGFYGWKLNSIAEAKALLENIKIGEVAEKEPIYTQKALYRDEDDIGKTYVEIDITRQHLWFYKNGKLITQGDVVTGNPNRGNSTKLGTYMLNYKQKGSTLRGENYEADVTYWMPFNGNIGIHDASWRYSFGGEIYKNDGTHGCVNAPLYLAKTIFENIEEGTPVICYEE